MKNSVLPPLLGLVFLLLLPLSLRAAAISVSVDRNPINVDETFQIIFTASQTPDANPDFSPLEKDFSVLGQSQAHRSSWVNGKNSQSRKWTVSVQAKQSGTLLIPPISFGKDRSPTLTIDVTAGATDQLSGNHNAELFLEVSAAPENPYLQAQVIYTLKLYTRVDIAQARLTEPTLADAVIEKLGEDSHYNTPINGIDYSVTERSYALFPQKSGVLTIPPLALTADVVASGQPALNTFLDPPFTRSQRLESKPVTLNVRPQPANFTGGQWLPAEQLELTQHWSGDTQNMNVGEPLTRTLTLTARGASIGQLPELNAGFDNDGIKTYADQPALSEQQVAGGVIAQRQEKWAFMPNQPGTYTLPEVAIPWFNTLTEKMVWAKLPAMTVTVVGAPHASTPTEVSTPDLPGQTAASKQPADPPQHAFFWPVLSALLACGWLLTGVFFWLKTPSKTSVDAAPEPSHTRQDAAVSRLRQACQANDAVAAKNALLAWGHEQYGETSLGAIAQHCEARLRDEMGQLNRVLYGKNSAQAWQGKALFQAFSENKARKKMADKVDSSLQPLYPS